MRVSAKLLFGARCRALGASSHPSSSRAVMLAGLILYSLFLLVTVGSSLRHLCRGSSSTPSSWVTSGGGGSRFRVSISGLFYMLVLLFLGCRIAWASVSLFAMQAVFTSWG